MSWNTCRECGRTESEDAADRRAVGIYVVMGRDPTDALEMINDCSDVRVLDTLHKMLTNNGSGQTDKELNALMAGPVARRLSRVKEHE